MHKGIWLGGCCSPLQGEASVRWVEEIHEMGEDEKRKQEDCLRIVAAAVLERGFYGFLHCSVKDLWWGCGALPAALGSPKLETRF